jgi:prepilin-type N-terminal cleavage/methylation domain-containing protein
MDKNLQSSIFNRQSKGFSLIELCIAIVIIAVGVVVIMQIYANGMISSVNSELYSVGAELGKGLIEEIKSKRFDENFDNNGTTSFTPASSLGPEAGETEKNTFDDVDDFNGWQETPGGYPGYSLSVSVFYTQEADLNAISTVITNYKRINLTVSKNGISDINLSTMAVGW